MRCTVCTNPLVNELDVLLSTGTSIRQVARLYDIPRTTVGRHRQHVAPSSAPFGVILGEGGSGGPADPLAEAFALAERAKTPRERLRALEQVRAATRLRLRGAEHVDDEDRGLLDRNVTAAEDAFRRAPDFETAARGLSGLREAILQRLDAVPAPVPVEVPVVVKTAEGTPLGTGTWPMQPEAYWRHVPRRFRDPERYTVSRVIRLGWGEGARGRVELKVQDKSAGGIAWVER
ncbi:MAG: hypothetical protein WD096_09950 [Actinomycetota bacterium]